MSVYGLVHFFRPGRVCLEEGNITISPEERDRIVRILKDHLLDVDEEERDPRSLVTSADYNSLPQTPSVAYK